MKFFGREKMKVFRILLFVLTFFAHELFCTRIQGQDANGVYMDNTYYPKQVPVTLTELAKTCFSQLPEWPKGKIYGLLTCVPIHEEGGEAVDRFELEKEPNAFKKAAIDKIQACTDTYEKTVFSSQSKWINANPEDIKQDFLDKKKCLDFTQKIDLFSRQSVCFVGGINGSLHSLLRLLLGLAADGRIDDNFRIINSDFKIIFLGSFSGSKSYDLAVFYTLCLLKLANWNNVYFVRGFDSTFGDGGLDYVSLKKFVNCLPLAIFVQAGSEKSAVQCCHGGINFGYSPKKLLEASEKEAFEKLPEFYLSEQNASDKPKGYKGLFDIKERYRVIMKYFAENVGYSSWKTPIKSNASPIPLYCHWGEDFLIYAGGWPGNFISTSWFYVDAKMKEASWFSKGEGLIVSLATVNEYLNDNGLRALFRALRLKSPYRSHDEVRTGMRGLAIPDGSSSWISAVEKDNRKDNKFCLVDAHSPVFTLSTSTGVSSRSRQPYDCYVIMKPADKWEDWTITVYEAKTPDEKTDKYVIVDLKEKGFFGPDGDFDDELLADKDEIPTSISIGAAWVEQKDKVKDPLGEELVSKIKKLVSVPSFNEVSVMLRGIRVSNEGLRDICFKKLELLFGAGRGIEEAKETLDSMKEKGEQEVDRLEALLKKYEPRKPMGKTEKLPEKAPEKIAEEKLKPVVRQDTIREVEKSQEKTPEKEIEKAPEKVIEKEIEQEGSKKDHQAIREIEAVHRKIQHELSVAKKTKKDSKMDVLKPLWGDLYKYIEKNLLIEFIYPIVSAGVKSDDKNMQYFSWGAAWRLVKSDQWKDEWAEPLFEAVEKSIRHNATGVRDRAFFFMKTLVENDKAKTFVVPIAVASKGLFDLDEKVRSIVYELVEQLLKRKKGQAQITKTLDSIKKNKDLTPEKLEGLLKKYA